jgi:hypothetical protein
VEVALAAPESAHDAKRFVRAPAASAEGDAQEAVLVLVPADTHAEREAAAGELLQGRRLLGEMDRMVQRREDDRRAEPYAAQGPGCALDVSSPARS